MSTESPLYLKRLLIGQMANFVYLVGSHSSRQCLVVDPAWDIDAILRAAAADDMEVTGALVTHYHPDHIGGDLFGHDIEGLATLLEKVAVPIHVQRKELQGVAQVTGLSEKDLVAHDPGEDLAIADDVSIKLLHTPGHTPGSQCFLTEGNLISGDTLFFGGCGRVDLPGGDAQDLYKSLTQVLGKLPEETCLHPGHQYGPVEESTMGEQLRTNPFLKVDSLQDWLAKMGYPG
jgi:glyoxylase-like metal-dependent hydrolase (beta-lactamase superfamily II)